MIWQAPIRVIKGLLMTFMFALFYLGMLVVMAFVFPALLAGNLGTRGSIASPELREQMQNVNRRLFAVWLRLMGLFGLLAVLPAKGRPIDRPCVMVANHPGLFDILVLICAVPRLAVMVKNSLIRLPPLGGIVKWSGYVLSPDNERESPLSSLYASVKMIRAGCKFFIFPEGTRSPAHELLPFKKGPFLLARLANVDIQPVLIRNEPPFLPKKAPAIRRSFWFYPPYERSTVALEFWDPIPPPAVGEEMAVAQELEARYRAALGVH